MNGSYNIKRKNMVPFQGSRLPCSCGIKCFPRKRQLESGYEKLRLTSNGTSDLKPSWTCTIEIKSAMFISLFINLYTYVTTVCAIYAAITKEMQIDNMIESRL